MPIDARQAHSQLNDKECFFLWYELGSSEKVAKNLAGKGKVNSETGKPFTPYAVWARSIRWVINNSADAREVYIKAGAEVAKDEDTWNRKLVRHAMTIYVSRNSFFSWLNRQEGFAEKYKDVYAKRYPEYD